MIFEILLIFGIFWHILEIFQSFVAIFVGNVTSSLCFLWFVLSWVSSPAAAKKVRTYVIVL
jgi:hypothetical protein